MKELQDALPPDSQTRLVTLTTDPDFDTPPVLKAYAERFGADPNRWMFLTGTKERNRRPGHRQPQADRRAGENGGRRSGLAGDLFVHSTIFVIADKRGAVARGVRDRRRRHDLARRADADSRRRRQPTGTRAMTLSDLPAVNACLNGLSAIFLGAGYYFIRRKNQIAHRNCMMAALLARPRSSSRRYLTYHLHECDRHRLPRPAWFRPIYLVILLTHTLLAVRVVPLALITLWRALQRRFDRRKKIARWTWPIWMYVSVTGVLIYLLLYQIFPQR